LVVWPPVLVVCILAVHVSDTVQALRDRQMSRVSREEHAGKIICRLHDPKPHDVVLLARMSSNRLETTLYIVDCQQSSRYRVGISCRMLLLVLDLDCEF
jgi:hypothetical protein